MRIQETDRILKESRVARQTSARQEESGMMERAWRAVSSLPEKVSGLFRKH
jgi:hypothetical protein